MNASSYLHDTLSSPLSIVCLTLIVIVLPLTVLGLRVMVALGRAEKTKRKSLLRDTGGTATIEFALLLPILLFLILTLAQTTMLMGGNIFVHYAAFAAARSAIVQIPYDYPAEPANVYYGSPGTPKYDAIQRSAAFALMPVASGNASGSGASGDADTGGFVQGLTDYYSAYGDTPPAWITNLAAQRLAYAMDSTDAALSRPVVNDDDATITYEPIDGLKLDPKDPIRVRVEHRLNLGVPYANRIFADGTQDDGIGKYVTLVATATLTNEGILDQMPPIPSIPRIP